MSCSKLDFTGLRRGARFPDVLQDGVPLPVLSILLLLDAARLRTHGGKRHIIRSLFDLFIRLRLLLFCHKTVTDGGSSALYHGPGEYLILNGCWWI